MNVAIFNTKPYDREFLKAANNGHGHELSFFEPHLSAETWKLAAGFPAVSAFVNDVLDETVLSHLAKNGTELVALRCAGFNNVDLNAADRLGLTVLRVPAYSPFSVAEHTVGLMLALDRQIYRAFNRVRENNFSLDGLMGFDLHGRTVGVVGTGKIGVLVAKIMLGFGCRVIAYDPFTNPECEALGVPYYSLPDLLSESDIISLHCPLTPDTHHVIREETIAQMKDGVMLINTSRGALIDTAAVVEALKSGKIGHLGLDVYEEESDLFFEDLSNQIVQDDLFARLTTFPNVIVTGHQAFFTKDALTKIADTTLTNISEFERGHIPEENEVTAERFLSTKRKA